jgi:hypothetical protein
MMEERGWEEEKEKQNNTAVRKLKRCVKESRSRMEGCRAVKKRKRKAVRDDNRGEKERNEAMRRKA